MSKLLIPNTCQVPNVLLDKIMSQVSGAAFKVAMAIARQTYGFQETSRHIGLTKLSELTGLSRPAVVGGIKELGELLTVKHGPKNSRTSNEYALNIDIATGGLVKKFNQSKNLTSQENEPELVKKFNQRLVKKVNSLKPTLKQRESGEPEKKPLPPNFELTDGMKRFATEKGLTSITAAFDKFVRWHRSKSTKSADWGSEWELWVLREVERKPQERKRHKIGEFVG
jgi:phage replication O-like protein O